MILWLFLLGCFIAMVAPGLVELKWSKKTTYSDGRWRKYSFDAGFFINFPLFCLGMFLIFRAM